MRSSLARKLLDGIGNMHVSRGPSESVGIKRGMCTGDGQQSRNGKGGMQGTGIRNAGLGQGNRGGRGGDGLFWLLLAMLGWFFL